MQARVVLDKAGRVVIPKSLRDELSLEPGGALEIESAGDQVTQGPLRRTAPLTKEYGVWVLHTGHPRHG